MPDWNRLIMKILILKAAHRDEADESERDSHAAGEQAYTIGTAKHPAVRTVEEAFPLPMKKLH